MLDFDQLTSQQRARFLNRVDPSIAPRVKGSGWPGLKVNPTAKNSSIQYLPSKHSFRS